MQQTVRCVLFEGAAGVALLLGDWSATTGVNYYGLLSAARVIHEGCWCVLTWCFKQTQAVIPQYHRWPSGASKNTLKIWGRQIFLFSFVCVSLMPLMFPHILPLHKNVCVVNICKLVCTSTAFYCWQIIFFYKVEKKNDITTTHYTLAVLLQAAHFCS